MGLFRKTDICERKENDVKSYTVIIVFNDGVSLSVDCDDFLLREGSHYTVMRDNYKIMTIPFSSVKYTKLVINDCELEASD